MNPKQHLQINFVHGFAKVKGHTLLLLQSTTLKCRMHLYLLSHIKNTTLSSTPQTFIYVSFLFLRCFFTFSSPRNILHALIQDQPLVGVFFYIFFHIRVYYATWVCVVCFSFFKSYHHKCVFFLNWRVLQWHLTSNDVHETNKRHVRHWHLSKSIFEEMKKCFREITKFDETT